VEDVWVGHSVRRRAATGKFKSVGQECPTHTCISHSVGKWPHRVVWSPQVKQCGTGTLARDGIATKRVYSSNSAASGAWFLTSRLNLDLPTSRGENETGRPPFLLLT